MADQSAWELFLSASVPRHVEGRPGHFVENVPPDVAFEINEAVVALTTATLLLGGRLVFGGHPSITPLVAQTVFDFLDYRPREAMGAEEGARDLISRLLTSEQKATSLSDCLPELPKADRPIVVYQSKIFEDVLIDDVMQLEDSGVAEVIMTPIQIEGRSVEVDIFQLEELRTNHTILGDSLRYMRTRMVERQNLVAMVALGGLQGVVDEAKAFAQHHRARPVYSMVGTGGATRYLQAESEIIGLVLADHRYLIGLIESQEGERPEGDHWDIPPTDLVATKDGSSPLPMTPYSLIMPLIVEDALSRSSFGSFPHSSDDRDFI